MAEADRESTEDLDSAWDEPEGAAPPSTAQVEVPEELDSGWDEVEPASVQRRRPSRKRRQPAPYVAKAPAAEPAPIGPSKKERREQLRRNRAHAVQRERERKAERKAERRQAALQAQQEREQARAELARAKAKALRKEKRARRQEEERGAKMEKAAPVVREQGKGSARMPVKAKPRVSPQLPLLLALLVMLGVAAAVYLLRR